MTPKQRALWTQLGWTKDNWATGQGAWSESRDWKQLPPDALAAAKQLGFDEQSWDKWDAMTEETRALWTKLGWDEESWASGEGVWSEGLDWRELKPEDRAIAKQLGFDEHSCA